MIAFGATNGNWEGIVEAVAAGGTFAGLLAAVVWRRFAVPFARMIRDTGRIAELAETVGDVAKDMRGLSGSVVSWVVANERRIDEVDGRLEVVVEDLGKVASRVGRLEHQLEALKRSVQARG